MTGKVWITGAGSEAGLITIRGLAAVRGAQVIVYDDLLDHRLLREAPEGCELICVGKRKDSHKKEQEEIHGILVDRARRGLKVVRLKGGDPTVFGRGGEEALALEAAGVPYEMIPGVSSCISALEHFGIPITQRGLASSFAVVTGHADSKTEESYETLAKLKGTIVFLMGHSRAGEIVQRLMRAGASPDTPVSVLSRVYMEDERRVDGTLKNLGEIAGEVQAPAILVIGKTASMHLMPADASAQALPSAARPQVPPRTVLVVGTRSFTDRMAEALAEDGLRTIAFPCIDIVPQAQNIPDDFSEYGWLVFTSANGVKVFLEELTRRRTDLRQLMHMKIACIGTGTARALEQAHLYADLIPDTFTSEGLAEELAREVRPGEKVLILRAAEGNPVLTNRLENEKIVYKDCRIYRAQYRDPGNVYFDTDGPGAGISEPGPSAKEIRCDVIVFASAGGVRRFLENNRIPEGARPVCIGGLTASELERLTGRRAAAAQRCSAEGIRDLIRTME